MELSYKKEGFIIYKLIPCILVTIVAFMCLYGSFVYASNDENNNLYTIYDTNKVVDLSPLDGYHYFFIACKRDDNMCSFVYVVSSSTIYCSDPLTNSTTTFSSDSPIFVRCGYANTFGPIQGGHIQYSINNAISNLENSTDYSKTINGHLYATCEDTYSLSDIPYVCSYDILDSDNNVVFQAPSHPTIIAEQVGEVEMSKTLQEIMGILPIVLVVIVGLIAIRKAIQFLIQTLKHQ